MLGRVAVIKLICFLLKKQWFLLFFCNLKAPKRERAHPLAKASDSDHVDHGHSPRERGVRALMFHRYRRALGGQKVSKRREDAFKMCPKQPDGAKTSPKCTQYGQVGSKTSP